VRRGLWPSHAIEVHGPHLLHADLRWGEARASVDGGHPICFDLEVAFKTARGIAGIHDMRGVPIEAKDRDCDGKRQQFPLVPTGELSRSASRWVMVVGCLHAELREEAIAAAWQSRERRAAIWSRTGHRCEE